MTDAGRLARARALAEACEFTFGLVNSAARVFDPVVARK